MSLKENQLNFSCLPFIHIYNSFIHPFIYLFILLTYNLDRYLYAKEQRYYLVVIITTTIIVTSTGQVTIVIWADFRSWPLLVLRLAIDNEDEDEDEDDDDDDD